MKKIILDTNMLLVPAQFKVDIFDEIQNIISDSYQLIVLDASINELKKISESKKKDSGAAKMALQFIDNKAIDVVKTKEKSVDKAILEFVDEDIIVATNDKLLQQKLRKKSVKVIYLRGKKKLELS